MGHGAAGFVSADGLKVWHRVAFQKSASFSAKSVVRTFEPKPTGEVLFDRFTRRFIMAETPKLSVEKALDKLRSADAVKSNSDRRDEEIDALDEETKRLREQRLRLERHQQRSTKRD